MMTPSTTNRLLAALVSAAAPFVGEPNAAELARNLVAPILDPEEKLEQVIDEALDARSVPRVGGWLLDETKVDVDALRAALVEAASPFCEQVDLDEESEDPDGDDSGWDDADDQDFDYPAESDEEAA